MGRGKGAGSIALGHIPSITRTRLISQPKSAFRRQGRGARSIAAQDPLSTHRSSDRLRFLRPSWAVFQRELEPREPPRPDLKNVVRAGGKSKTSIAHLRSVHPHRALVYLAVRL